MMQHVLSWHQRHGHRIVLVSASVEDYIKPIGLVVGADAALATRLEVSPTGALTGSYAGENCRGEEKLRRLDEWINEALPATPRAEVTLVAYGNSRGDLTMMGAALLGINCGKLGPLSRLSSYPTLEEMWRATAMVG
jgi:HAD superfamily phosphoserine phosphatase-like hydrolase